MQKYQSLLLYTNSDIKGNGTQSLKQELTDKIKNRDEQIYIEEKI